MIEGQIMSSDDEKVDEVELKAAEKSDTTEEEKNRVNEAQMRYEVAREIEETPVFKVLKKTTQDENIGLMLDVIVDRYFENGGMPIDPALFKVDAELVQMALRQTIYLISVEENGIVLDDTGNVDVESTLQQQANMGTISIDELSSEEKVKFFEKALDEGEKDNYKTKDEASVTLDKFFDEWEHHTVKEMTDYAKSENGIKEKAISLSKSKEKSEEARDASHLETKEDVFVMDICGEIVDIAAVPSSQYSEDTKKKLIMALKKLEPYKEGAAKGLFNKDGKVNLRKVIKKYQEYEREYQLKENLATLDEFKSKKYFDLSPEEKKQYLEAAFALYHQDGGKYKREALRALAEVDVLEKGVTSLKIDIKKFTNEYNAVTNEKHELKPLEVKSIIFRNQRGLAKENIEFLLGMIKDGTFKDQTIEERKVQREKEQAEKAKNGESKTVDKKLENILDGQTFFSIDGIKAVQVGIKESLSEKISRRLHANYTKGKFSLVDKKLDQLYSKFSDEQIYDDKDDLKSVIAEQVELIKDRKWELEQQRRQEAGEDIEILDDTFSRNSKAKKMESEKTQALNNKGKDEDDQFKLSKKEELEARQNARTIVISEQKSLAIAMAYARSIERDKANGRDKDSAATIFLREYMLEHTNSFGKYIDSDEKGMRVNVNKINRFKKKSKTNGVKNKREHLSDENLDAIIDSFQEVKLHKRTPGLILRGAYEATKDVMGVARRKVLSTFSFGMKKLGVGSAQLMIGENRIQDLQDYINNDDKKSSDKSVEKRGLLDRFGFNKQKAFGNITVSIPNSGHGMKEKTKEEMSNIANHMVGSDGQFYNVVNDKKIINVHEEALKESLQDSTSVSRIITANQEKVMASVRLKQFQDACISAIQTRGLQAEGMENWPLDALARFLAKNGGLEIVQGLREEYGLVDMKNPIRKASQAKLDNSSRIGANREDDDDFTL